MNPELVNAAQSLLEADGLVTEIPSYSRSEPLKITRLSHIQSTEATMNVSRYCHKNVTHPHLFSGPVYLSRYFILLRMLISPCLPLVRFCACPFHFAYH